ncbi:hypothetical protein FRB94_013399 [Tulasnella sp. JGI-2019a]|nr:hypothetical protein FRB94_013399 [Tulasnella sp. JGI-2019a]KAG9037800.1 hypothetical protein FRB95_004087 [Tulasnella sp. JGI-2019a]
MGDLPLDVAHLLGFGASMLLYGWYSCMFQGMIKGLWARRRRSRVVVWVTISLFLITTSNIALCVASNYNGWIKYRVNPGVEIYYGPNTWTANKCVQGILICIAAAVADILVCWRLYAIWDKNWQIVLFPAVLVVVDISLGLTICIIAIATRSYDGGPKYSTLFRICEYANTAGTLTTNIYATSLIIARLWGIGSRTQTPQGRGVYNSVILSVVQSGALQTTSLLVFTVFLFTGHYGVGAFMQYIVIMVIAISPLLIVMQLNEKLPPEPNSAGNSTTDDEANEAANAGSFNLGFALKQRSKKIGSPPIGRLVLSPIDTLECRTFHPSASSYANDLESRSHASGQDSVNRQKTLVTVPSLSNSKNDMRLRLQEDGDFDAEKSDYENPEEEYVEPLPSPKFATDLDYFPYDERRPREPAAP